MKKIISYTVIPALATLLPAMPIQAQDSNIQQAATQVEQAIQAAMSQSNTGNGPTLGQLGGVQAGSTAFDAGGGAGGDGSSGGGGSGGSGGGGSCFLAGTLIAMADGSSKAIETVNVGDMVLAFCSDSGRLVTEEVLSLHAPISKHYYTVRFEDSSTLYITGEHPLWSKVDGQKCWASIDQHDEGFVTKRLKVGSRVYTKDLDWVAVTSIDRIEKDVQTYNLENVSNTHTFIAGGKVVHNSKAGGSD